MADPLITAGFDPASLGAISRLAKFQDYLEAEVGGQMIPIGNMLVQDMQAKTWEVFANPTGNLADHIRAVPNGAMSVEIQVEVPYGWRMEEGFHGTDSLGRVYDQEGKPYAMPVLEEDSDKIAQMMNLAAADAIARMGVAR